MVDGHDKEDVKDKKEGVDEMKVEDVITSSDKGTKKILRWKEQKAEGSLVNTVPTPPKLVNRNMDASKMKEALACNDSSNDNEKGEVKSDGIVESPVMAVIYEDEVGKGGGKDLKVDKNVKGASSYRKVAMVKRMKVVAKAKGGITHDESAPTKSTREEKLNLKVDGNLTSAATNTIPSVEKMDIEGIKDYANEAENVEVASENVEVASDRMLKVTKKRKNKAAITSTSSIDADKSKNPDKRNSSATEKRLKKANAAEKGLKKVDGMGLIFMCNAKTKKDCYRYNILGLPESKKDLVAKVYKGMRLFLYDVDLKLMYGIYKAASQGGYKIEPKAFDSKFPSQVSFTVLRDCLPLPEEKFKAAIKENYYGRHKFNCKLSPEQVKELCKLFQSAGKASEKNRTALRKRRPHFDVSGVHPTNDDVYAREALQSPPRAAYRSPPRRTHSIKDDIYAREAYRSLLPRATYRSPRFHPIGDDIHARAAFLSPPRAHYWSPPPQIHPINDDIHTREAHLSPPPRYPYLSPSPQVHPINDDIYAREAYLSPHPQASYWSPPRAFPLPTLSRAYPQPPLASDSYYNRDHQRILDVETRPRDPPVVYQDSYILHREPASYHGTLYPSSLPPEHARRFLPPHSPPRCRY